MKILLFCLLVCAYATPGLIASNLKVIEDNANWTVINRTRFLDNIKNATRIQEIYESAISGFSLLNNTDFITLPNAYYRDLNSTLIQVRVAGEKEQYLFEVDVIHLKTGKISILKLQKTLVNGFESLSPSIRLLLEPAEALNSFLDNSVKAFLPARNVEFKNASALSYDYLEVLYDNKILKSLANQTEHDIKAYILKLLKTNVKGKFEEKKLNIGAQLSENQILFTVRSNVFGVSVDKKVSGWSRATLNFTYLNSKLSFVSINKEKTWVDSLQLNQFTDENFINGDISFF